MTSYSKQKSVIACPKKQVIKIEISDLCLQSSPCKHYVTLYYYDNTQEDVILNSRQIYDKYKHLIDEKEVSHYAYVSGQSQTMFKNQN